MADVANWEVASIDTNGNLTTSGGIKSHGGISTETGSVNEFLGITDIGDDNGEKLRIYCDLGVYIYALPTTDPVEIGRVWVDASAGYALKVSQG